MSKPTRDRIAGAVIAAGIAGAGVVVVATMWHAAERFDRETAIADQVEICRDRETKAWVAGQTVYALAWSDETERARKGLGCRNNITADGRISED